MACFVYISGLQRPIDRRHYGEVRHRCYRTNSIHSRHQETIYVYANTPPVAYRTRGPKAAFCGRTETPSPRAVL